MCVRVSSVSGFNLAAQAAGAHQCECFYVRMSAWVDVYARMCTCVVCACVYVCMYVCMYRRSCGQGHARTAKGRYRKGTCGQGHTRTAEGRYIYERASKGTDARPRAVIDKERASKGTHARPRAATYKSVQSRAHTHGQGPLHMCVFVCMCVYVHV